MSRRLLLLSGLLALCVVKTPPANAEEGLDEIVVTATRLSQPLPTAPLSISVIRGDDITLGRQQLGIDEALLSVPGLFIQDRYNFAQDLRIAIRGFGARSSFGIRGVKLIVDDIPLTLPDGQGQLDSLDLASAASIEVIRGPAAAYYGNASGGLIRVRSEAPPDEPYIDVGLAGGADGFARARFRAAGRVGATGYVLSTSALDYDGFRDHARTRQRSANLTLTRSVGATGELTLSANVADQPLAEDPGGVNAALADTDPAAARDRNVEFDAGEVLEQWRVAVTYRHALTASIEARWRIYGVDRDFSNKLPFVGGGQVDLDREFRGGGLELAGTVSPKIRWLVGLDVDDQNDRRLRFDNVSGVRGPLAFAQRETVRSDALFATLSVEPAERWLFNIGARYDRLRFRVRDTFLADGDDSGQRRFEQFSPVVGASIRLTDRIVAFANAARSFETPTTTEFANPTGGGFNPALEPQIANSAEIGLRWQSGESLRASIVYYDIRLNDELTPFEIASQPDRNFFENAGRSRRNGVEATLDWRPQQHWRVALAYTGSDFRFTRFTTTDGEDLTGRRTPGIPRHLFTLSADYRTDRYFVGAEFVRAGRMTLTNSGSAEQGPYSVIAARAGRTWETPNSRWRLHLGVNNAGNERYPANTRINAFGGRYFEAAPPRYLYAGFDWRFAHARR